ncbi:MBL fold metallo-hydrolase [Parathalassolituus penaei]|uniref:MBL fold metallo-hydrolase n=1 Tax=Parathalassolituus penaei TaxID=2997323 RepID=A0A9X3EEN3_9GAMM|nr:MBL fold metallo-hydrolase [Parathalassolituus penaei]MCY0965404.1 MBL fold metallo-hydrolase [Parathalassolituus penaei]
MKYWLLLLVLVVVAGLAVFWYLQQPRFGQLPENPDWASSPNYRDGEFQNLEPTPMLTTDTSRLGLMWDNLTNPGVNTAPAAPLPVVKTDLFALPADQNVLVWLGHSSFYLQLNGKRLLVDPILSGYAAPISLAIPAFAGTTVWTADDFPELDYLLITHDHWDHLDYDAVMALKPKVKQVVAPLGVGSYFRQWGFDAAHVNELDWFDTLNLEGVDGLDITLIPGRHFSGRLLTPNKTLWGGYVLEVGGKRYLIGGDSGPGIHYQRIAEHFPDGFDLVMLDSGQYDPRWANVHMTPEQSTAAADLLKTRTFMPVHIGRFQLAKHPWNEPFERALNAASQYSYRIITPRIGATVWLDDNQQAFDAWWRGQ